MAFRVGQKVVCVDAAGTLHLKNGEIYTIKRIEHRSGQMWRGHYYDGQVLLVNEARPNPGHNCFSRFRFCPVVERETDISIHEDAYAENKRTHVVSHKHGVGR